jgi:hypothetical protein
MVAVPALRNVRTPPLVMVHTSGVSLVNVTGSVESEVAVSVGWVPKFCAPGFANVIVCGALGITLFDAAEAWPVPALFVAVTVNVYATPFVSPATVIGLPVPVPVKPPGLDVTV